LCWDLKFKKFIEILKFLLNVKIFLPYF
jgi:hypothetical protein